MTRAGWIGSAVGLAVLAGGFALAVAPRRVPVDTAQVNKGALRVSVDEDGRTRVKDRYVVSAPIPGQLLRIALKPGDPVRAGDVVAHLNATSPPLLDARARSELQARLRAAEDGASGARAELTRAGEADAFATREMERVEQLAAVGAEPVRNLDAQRLSAHGARQALESARFSARVADHEVDLVRASLGARAATGDCVEVTSPVDGKVLRVITESSGVVAAGTPLIEVGDPASLEVLADLLTPGAVRVAAGAPAEILRWGGDAPLRAVVRLVEPSAFTKVSALGVDEQRVNVILDLLDPPEARPRLGDGYRVEVSITVYQASSVTVVPAGALFRRADQWAAFVVVDGRARLKEVQPGQRGDLDVEVLSGLSPGDTVIIYPGDRVAEGVRVASP